MTKEQYIQYFKGGNIQELIYEFYKENFNGKIHKPFLNANTFFQMLIFLNAIDYCREMVVKIYESKFNIVRIFNKEKQLINLI